MTPSRIPRPHAILLAARLLAASIVLLPASVLAQEPAGGTPAADRPVSADGLRLPEPVTTRHEFVVDGEPLAFSATAGVLTLTGSSGEEEADIAYVAYVDPEADPARRPVTFVVNGGPGAASAYLHLGALGPWTIGFGEDVIVPSAPPALSENPDTWLAFTDLVFVDPVGTGYSRLVAPSDQTRSRYLSVSGDIAALADFVVRWSVENGRAASPKAAVGESYGGFRMPLLADTLASDRGMALSALVLVSPVLDFAWISPVDTNLMGRVALLPSLAAAALDKAARISAGEASREALAEVEAYATGEYVSDLLAGLSDEDAVGRVVARIADLTGLPEDLVRRQAGRIDASFLARELWRDEGRVGSLYDTGVTTPDPAPTRATPRYRDPVLDALTAPLTAAALTLYREKLDWVPERQWVLLNGGVSRAWDYGSARSAPEALGALAAAMALDESLDVVVVHGLTDLVTPYFASTLVLRQLPASLQERIVEETYPGGHMFYTRPASRAALARTAREAIAGD
ncbi:S10 family peptidase [Salinarimonas chemoclinalis]|uniref:S10 family peptidase n=1 Tax=Salinarimonas chemoclinalis TaxID=3241599 RepID=UPI003558DE0A